MVRGTGNRAYTVARLRRDHPALADPTLPRLRGCGPNRTPRIATRRYLAYMTDMADIEKRIADLEARIADLTQRLAAVENGKDVGRDGLPPKFRADVCALVEGYAEDMRANMASQIQKAVNRRIRPR